MPSTCPELSEPFEPPFEWTDELVDECVMFCIKNKATHENFGNNPITEFKDKKINEKLVSHERPPLGIQPLWLRNESRLIEIKEAMNRYEKAGMKIPKEWLNEKESIESFKKLPLLVTEDGVSIYYEKNDMFYTNGESSCSIGVITAKDWLTKYNNYKEWKVFYHKQNAEKYIAKHEKKFSEHDICDALEKLGWTSFLKNALKQKLGIK